MAKRSADDQDTPLKDRNRPEGMEVDPTAADMGEFADEFEDEFESEDEIMEAGVDGRPDAEREADEAAMALDNPQSTFIVGRTKLEPGQILAPDPSTYHMLHQLSTPWPCLSFDVIPDGLGDDRSGLFPATMYTVAGTQADRSSAGDNSLLVMKLSGLSRMERTGGDESDSDDDEEDSEPILESKHIPLSSTTNRVRTTQFAGKTLSAAMLESAECVIHDITPHLQSFDVPGTVVSAAASQPVYTVKTHRSEGYGIDWTGSNVPEPKLLTGDNDGLIYMTSIHQGNFITHEKAFKGHTSSVEDIQWSPSEASVFASASSDGTVRVWDIRSKSRKPALTQQISQVDVNVISWSRTTTHLLASGDDNGVFSVWDLRNWKPNAQPSPIASFNYHKEQITSVEWHPTDDSIVAVAAGDNTVTLWDLAVELDDEESKDTAGVADIPPQLLFVHYLADVKEVHWHKQIPGTLLATGEQFNAFKTISV